MKGAVSVRARAPTLLNSFRKAVVLFSNDLCQVKTYTKPDKTCRHLLLSENSKKKNNDPKVKVWFITDLFSHRSSRALFNPHRYAVPLREQDVAHGRFSSRWWTETACKIFPRFSFNFSPEPPPVGSSIRPIWPMSVMILLYSGSRQREAKIITTSAQVFQNKTLTSVFTSPAARLSFILKPLNFSLSRSTETYGLKLKILTIHMWQNVSW